MPNSHWGRWKFRRITSWDFSTTGVVMFLYRFCLLPGPPSPCSDQAQPGSLVELARMFLTCLPPPAQLCTLLAPCHRLKERSSPGKGDRLCYLFLWQPLASSCPFPSQCRRTPNISLCSRRKQRRSNSSKHWLETPFLYTNYLQASSTNVWCEKSCFPQSSKTLLSMCRSELWKFIQRWLVWKPYGK